MSPRRTAAQRREARHRFVKAANTRVNLALAEIRKIGKLSSERYEYGPDDVTAIIRALQDAVDRTKAQLEGQKPEDERITVIAE
jgi:hypothetical protein